MKIELNLGQAELLKALVTSKIRAFEKFQNEKGMVPSSSARAKEVEMYYKINCELYLGILNEEAKGGK